MAAFYKTVTTVIAVLACGLSSLLAVSNDELSIAYGFIFLGIIITALQIYLLILRKQLRKDI